MSVPLIDWLLRWADAIGAYGSVLLALVLAILYRQQKELLSASFRASHRAVIEKDSVDARGDEIHLALSNVGNGVAIEPRLVVLGVYTEADGEVNHGIIRSGWIEPIKTVNLLRDR